MSQGDPTSTYYRKGFGLKADVQQDLAFLQRQAEEQQAEANARIAALSRQNKELETSL